MEQRRFIDNAQLPSVSSDGHARPRVTPEGLGRDWNAARPGAGSPARMLLHAYASALGAVEGRGAVARALRGTPISAPTWTVALGKAADAMALGALDVLGSAAAGGLVVAKQPSAALETLAAAGFDCRLGGHPLPTQASLDAGAQLLALLQRLGSGDRLLFLISGGASSLIEVPVAGLDLATLRRANTWLLGSGLPISAVNRVRRALSRIKGGGLISHLPTRQVRVLAISDVLGDDPGVIGSGLLAPRPRPAPPMDLDLPDWLAEHVHGGRDAHPPAADRAPQIEIVARLCEAKQAAARFGREGGAAVHLHPDAVAGDAAEQGARLAAMLMEGPPGLHIWGGETTVRLPERPGRGGRNQHLALAAALVLAGRGDCWLLAAGTDGTDGDTEDAGALVDGRTVERACDAGLEARQALDRADSGTLLAASGDLIHTGPTGTNVMDLMLGLKSAP